MKDLKSYVITQFGSKTAQNYYIRKATSGLWKPEEILIKKYFKPKSKVLDLGCGTGRATIPLFKQDFDVVGVDITPNMIKNAKKIAKKNKLNIKYELGDATKLRFKDNTFDCILFSNNGWAQIPYEKERISALKEINRILKKNGHYIFATNTRSWFEFPFFMLTKHVDFGDLFFRNEGGGLRYDKKQFVHIPSLPEVKNQLKDAGFELVHHGTYPMFKNFNLLLPMFYVCKKSD